MKTWTLRIAVITGLVVAAFWFRDRTPPPGAPEVPGEPSAPVEFDWSGASRTVTEFFQAAGEGDDRAYLELVDGPLRRLIEQNRAELGIERFRESLERSAEGIKGLAVTPGPDTSDGTLALDVEIVFADRNETQRMLLAPRGKGWVITSIEEARMIEPAVPYGTPVFNEAPADAE